jgi:hypothetical protein
MNVMIVIFLKVAKVIAPLITFIFWKKDSMLFLALFKQAFLNRYKLCYSI